ncbi:MAG: hypothetical protein BGN98_09515 [Microbacterium sp. 69-7]|jgi:hypothetical protein|uniref:hypothetical protein n=1 Tax=unclassified Microbacterium TaxID=2609290 RepID=UPI00086EC053|nr:MULTISPECIES: hypothetical protein [unclassified Microbacterium]ODT25565.1 MAG: hypothetical protein ABS64_01375 [Microbacterium sp. SCN 69-37]OJU44850.1 MAG: hypothetical protein BGN98_09515 [Microbacterium sp. 69-7]
MTTTQVAYETISTRIYDSEEGYSASNNNMAYRAQDLEDYGRRGFALISTVTAPTHDGTLIIDTLARTAEAE